VRADRESGPWAASNTTRARCGHRGARTSNQMLRRMLPTAERTVTPDWQPKEEENIDKGGAIIERPLGFEGFVENFDGRIDCDHLSGLLTRHHDRWPRWVPRSSPKQSGGLEGRDTKRVLWIVGSTDRHLIQLLHPGTLARLRRCAANAGPATHVIVTHAARAIPLLNHVRSPLAVRPPEARRDRVRQSRVGPSRRFSGRSSSLSAYSTWRSMSAVIVSFQRRIRLRRSVGRRTRMTGAPSARAAR